MNMGASPSPSHSHARISRTRFFAASRLDRGASEYSSKGVSSSSVSFATSDSSSLLVDDVDAVDVVAVLARLNQPPLGGEGGVRGDDVWRFLGRSLESHEVICEVSCEALCEISCNDIDEDDGVEEGDDGGLEALFATPVDGWTFTAFFGRSLESHEVFCDEAPEDVEVDESVGEGEDGG